MWDVFCIFSTSKEGHLKNILYPEAMINTIIVSGIIFAVFWYLDHRTHLKIWKQDITDKELKTHRLILFASYGLQISFVVMYWTKWVALPIFIACWMTRLLHETIDEFKFHVERCTPFEDFVHLGMWITIHIGIVATFIWGFWLEYDGISTLSIMQMTLLIALFVVYGIIGSNELNSYKQRD